MEIVNETLRKIGRDIFHKYVTSSFVPKHLVRALFENAIDDATEEIEAGFYQAEDEWTIAHPEYLSNVRKNK